MSCKVIVVYDMLDTMFVFKKLLQFYGSYGLTPPNVEVPVISMELRDAINKYGVVNIPEMKTGKAVEYIPPHMIKRVKYIVAEDENEMKKILGLKKNANL